MNLAMTEKNKLFDFLKETTITDKAKDYVNGIFEAPEEKGVTTLELVIKVGSHRIDSLFLQSKIGVANRYKLRIRKIQDAFGMSKYKTVFLIFDMGLTFLENVISSKGESFDLNEEDKGTIEAIKENVEIMKRQQDMALYEPIYEDRGIDGFLEWAEKTEQSSDRINHFLSNFTYRSERMKPSMRDNDWLVQYLQKCPNHKADTKQIKKAAMEAGIINDDKDWQRLQKNAERNDKIQKGYGEWMIAFFPLPVVDEYDNV